MGRDKWAGPKEHKLARRLSFILVILALSGGLAYSVVTRPHPVIQVVSPPPEGLSTVEQAGVTALVARFSATPTHRQGDVTVNGMPLAVDVSMSGDNRFGSGTVIAGRVSGRAALIEGTTYLSGTREFWGALGSTAVKDTAWIRVPLEFLDNKVFLPVNLSAVTTPEAKLSESTVTANNLSVTLALTPAGVSKIVLPDYDMDISPAQASALAMPEGPDPAHAAHLVRTGGSWQIEGSPPPPPPEGESGGETTSTTSISPSPEPGG